MRAHDTPGDEPAHAARGRKDETLLHNEQPIDEVADHAHGQDVAPVPELNDREDAIEDVLPNSRDISPDERAEAAARIISALALRRRARLTKLAAEGKEEAAARASVERTF
jgi:hypothetical protein